MAWAGLSLVLLALARVLDRRVFLEQANLLAVAVVIRSLAHNIFGGSYFVAGEWHGRFSILSITAALLLATLPVAFRLRARYREQTISKFDRWVAIRYPEQVFFFAPVSLATVTIAVKMNAGMITLSWGIEGVILILLGLLVSQRSYRLTGLVLLLLCVAKIVVCDAWLLRRVGFGESPSSKLDCPWVLRDARRRGCFGGQRLVEKELLTTKIAYREVGKNNGNELRLAGGRAGGCVAAEKCQLKPILPFLPGLQVSGEVPPFSLIAGMIVQIAGKLNDIRLCSCSTGSLYLQRLRFYEVRGQCHQNGAHSRNC